MQFQQRADEMSALAQQEPGFESFNNQNQNSSGDAAAATPAAGNAEDATFNAVAANASNSGQFENMGYDQVASPIIALFPG